MFRPVILMCLETRRLENYWRAINWIFQPSDAEELSVPFVLVGDEVFTLSEHVLRHIPIKR